MLYTFDIPSSTFASTVQGNLDKCYTGQHTFSCLRRSILRSLWRAESGNDIDFAELVLVFEVMLTFDLKTVKINFHIFHYLEVTNRFPGKDVNVFIRILKNRSALLRLEI